MLSSRKTYRHAYIRITDSDFIKYPRNTMFIRRNAEINDIHAFTRVPRRKRRMNHLVRDLQAQAVRRRSARHAGRIIRENGRV